jgi:GT2 family glycosyltransferase
VSDRVLKSALVICTRNRRQSLEGTLQSWSDQRVRPPAWVVDSSDGDSTEVLVRSLAATLPTGALTYLSTPPGLTRQRAAGVTAVPSDVDVVHFVDDDVSLHPGYFSGIESVFASRSDVIGVGGLITNVRLSLARPLGDFFLLTGKRQGAVLASGVVTPVSNVVTPLEVEWLSGCSMSYRRSLFTREQFDLRLVGYCAGEDVEFSLRARRYGRLVVTPAARLEHHWAPGVRPEGADLHREYMVQRCRLTRESGEFGLSPAAFWWSAAGELIVCPVEAVTQLRPSQLRRARATVQACLEILSGRRRKRKP